MNVFLERWKKPKGSKEFGSKIHYLPERHRIHDQGVDREQTGELMHSDACLQAEALSKAPS